MFQLVPAHQLPSFMPERRAIFFLHFSHSSQVWKPEISLNVRLQGFCFFYTNSLSRLLTDWNHGNF